MKAKRFLEKLTDNLSTKIFCFVIALFLFLFYQLSLVDRRTVVLPLRVVQDGAVVRVGDIPSSVRVVVRANSSDANLVHADGIKASLNLNYLSENGTFEIPVFLSVDDDLLEIDPLELRTKPEYVSVTVEKKMTKAVRIETPFIGEVAQGYGLSGIDVKPNFVYVTGPESIVSNTETISTNTVDITDFNSNHRFNVSLVKSNRILEYDEADAYSAEVIVEPLDMERFFRNVEINCINLSDSFFVENKLPLCSFKLAGTVPMLEKYRLSGNVAVVDLSSITEAGEYELPVKLRIPAYFKVLDKSIDSVKVKIAAKEIEGEGGNEKED